MSLSVDPARTSRYSCIIHPESAVETVRLLNSARLYTQLMGGLLVEQPDPAALQDVLDIGCGPGMWALDLAFTYPEMQMVGIDVSEQRISLAHTLACEQGLSNAHFRVMDATGLLAFPDTSFDLVNAQFLFEDLPMEVWVPLLRECRRVLRPGGILRLTESEVGFSNSPAHEHLWQLYLRASAWANHAGSPDGRHLGIINQLQLLMRRAGFQSPDAFCRLYSVEYSFGAGKRQEWCEDLMLKVHHTLPFLVRMEVAAPDELEQCVRRMHEEVWHPNFNGMVVVLTTWGRKP
jgi:SAM-dependent methyltransferase